VKENAKENPTWCINVFCSWNLQRNWRKERDERVERFRQNHAAKHIQQSWKGHQVRKREDEQYEVGLAWSWNAWTL